ncbi:hypothetical protein BDP55DRAFT_252196 [Colletotrichum godetiae]|uniref:Uncharacterized protein n=1 Tax=Colletotrichum godetiae TaxID=1209918 RepID=A0AAJ0EUI4_9PEZI|nr:uncharacterized protein BDP55DRAFT_252196 [Colletotrichum godetiae]KAK1672249.1 hypothetical protein BDP55DRAFT_252196 [Colletotrichum godetiae]
MRTSQSRRLSPTLPSRLVPPRSRPAESASLVNLPPAKLAKDASGLRAKSLWLSPPRVSKPRLRTSCHLSMPRLRPLHRPADMLPGLASPRKPRLPQIKRFPSMRPTLMREVAPTTMVLAILRETMLPPRRFKLLRSVVVPERLSMLSRPSPRNRLVNRSQLNQSPRPRPFVDLPVLLP